ncbi:Uncharacterised protein [Enterobacter hormaechei]|nr:Uncharacterised protein [Enterobacter hormaechei]
MVGFKYKTGQKILNQEAMLSHFFATFPTVAAAVFSDNSYSLTVNAGMGA